MATLSVTNPTLLDLAKMKDPDGSIADIVEILNETNGILDDVTFMEGNLETGHRHTMRTGIPAPTYVKLYGGVQPNKSTTVQVTDNCAILEAYAEVDKRLADMANNQAAWRLSEDRAHIEGLAQEVAYGLFYNDEDISPEKFTGLAPRYNALTGSENSDNVISGGGTTDNSSIWLVGWGPNACMGIVPKGSVAGLKVRDLGEDTKTNSDGSMYQVYRTHYSWHVGLALRDWRKVVRVANLNKTLLLANSGLYTAGAGFASSAADLSDLMHKAISRLPNGMASGERYCFYMSRDVFDSLRRQVSAKTVESTLQMENVGGTLITSFMGIPIKRVDALAADEAEIS